MTERITRMANGVLKKRIYPTPIEIKYDRSDYMLSERIRETKRLCEYMLAQEVAISENARLVGLISFDKCPYPSDFMQKIGFKHTRELIDSFMLTETPFEDFKFWGWQHATADFAKFIEIGVEGVKEQIAKSLEIYSGDEDKVDFLNACMLMCDGIISWELKCAKVCKEKALQERDEKRKKELLLMSENLMQVPRYPAKSFYQALQTIYFCFDFLSDSLGLPDRWLYKYYKRDIENGTLTNEQAGELLQEFFIRIQSRTPIDSPSFTKGGECNFSIGGYTLDGNDGYNELSELIVTSLVDLPLYIPQITFRYTSKTPFETLKHLLDLSRNDKNGRIAFVNDDVKIECLMKNCDIPWNEAINYVTIGCNMIALSGGIWYGTGYANQVKPLNETLYKRRKDILKANNFDEFFAIYLEELHKHLNRDIEVGTRLLEYASKDECILGSLFMNGCIEKGLSIHKGGASGFSELGGGAGLMCTVDSLAIIKQFVYDEKIVTAEQMLDALESNWQGYEQLYNMIMKKGKFFGNDYPESDEVAIRVTTAINEFARKRTDIFGKHYLGVIAPGYRDYHKWFGSVIGATPDGRYKGEPFKTIGAGQTGGRDRNGLTALLNSVAKYDPTRHFSGVTVTNINLDEKLIYDDNNLEKTARLIEGYFKSGGAQLQINTVTKEELLKAKANPSEYKSLRVRVSGFSDYFVNLSETMQENIIERTVLK